MQRGLAKITCFVHINAGVDESLGCGEITPSDNAMKAIIAVTATRIYIRKIGIGKIACVAKSGKYLF